MLKMPGCGSLVLRYAHGHLHENRVWSFSEDGDAVGYIGSNHPYNSFIFDSPNPKQNFQH
jgi:hypothetical protein